jgi:hypothetical protein
VLPAAGGRGCRRARRVGAILRAHAQALTAGRPAPAEGLSISYALTYRVAYKASKPVDLDTGTIYAYDGKGVTGVPLAHADTEWRTLSVTKKIDPDATTALHETSVLFAALIGTVVLREPLGPARIVAAGFITLGIVLIAHAR